MLKGREFTQRSVDSLHRQLNDILVYLDGMVLDPQWAEIRTHLESLLKIVNNSGEFQEAINRLDDEGLKKYQKMLRALFFELTYEKRADYYFGDILESHIFQKVNVSGNSEITENTTATVNNLGTRTWTHISNYIIWVNRYYALTDRRWVLQSNIDRLRKNPRRNRIEIAKYEEEIRSIDDLRSDFIHRINTHYTRDNFGNKQFITIEDTLPLNENNGNAEAPQGVILQTISDWGPVISITAYSTGFVKIGLFIDGITLAADLTPTINALIQTGDWDRFIQTTAIQLASNLAGRSASNAVIRNLTRGLSEDEIAERIGRALQVLVNTFAGRLIETMSGGRDER